LARDNGDAQCSSCRRSSALKPPSVPRDFWNTTQMQHALATRHIGRIIYVYRTHPWHGRQLSQDVVAGWLGLTQPQLSRIESGRAIEDLGRLIPHARALGIPRELLWFKLPDDDTADTGATPTLTLPVIVGGRSVLLPIDVEAARAQGLDGLLNQLTNAEETAQQLDGLPFPVHVPPQRNRTIQALAGSDIAELQHLAAALDDARRYMDGSVVGLFRQQLVKCKADDGSHGPAKVLPLTLGILGAISQHVREVKPDIRQALLTLGAETAEFAGWLYRDLHDTTTAAYWYDRAMEWAQGAHDTAMQGYVLLKKAQMAYDERDAHQMTTLAQAANRSIWQLPDRVRVEATQQEARGLAMLGEPFELVERKLDEAEQLFATAGTDDRPQFGTYFSTSAALTRRALCYVEAGKPSKATDLFGTVLASNELTHRDEGFFRALRSYACALSGEPDAAAQEGLSALTIATSTNSERTTRELHRTVKVLTPWSSRPGPRQLREALRTVAR
jgi:transcriptional regulator with XRE-family HTH domain